LASRDHDVDTLNFLAAFIALVYIVLARFAQYPKMEAKTKGIFNGFFGAWLISGGYPWEVACHKTNKGYTLPLNNSHAALSLTVYFVCLSAPRKSKVFPVVRG